MKILTRPSKARRAATALAVAGASLVGAIAVAPSATAAGRNGICETGEFCYYYNSDNAGSVSDFTTSLGNYGATQPDCYDFKGVGSGQGLCIKNDAASVWNRSSVPVTVYYNSYYGGASQTIPAGTQVNLNATLKNNNASHRFGTTTPPPSSTSVVGGYISRTEVLSRAKYWVNRHVPYSMYAWTYDPQGRNYRTDCSGFVSMALHLPESANTVTLPKYVYRISWSDLRPGDVVGTLGYGTEGSNGHVVIFNGWANSAHTYFYTLEERGGAGAVSYVRPTSFKVGTRYALPYRYTKITG